MSLFFQAKNITSRVIDRCFSLDKWLAKRQGCYILAYHRVLPERCATDRYVQPGMWISPHAFEQQILWMQGIGKIVSLDEMLIQQECSDEQDKPLFCLTFDDGWKDNYEYAFPILKRHGVSATIFLVTDSVNSGSLFWVESFIERAESTFEDQETNVRDFWYNVFKVHQDRFQGLMATEKLIDEVVEKLKRLPRDQRQQSIVDFDKKFNLQSKSVSRQVLSWAEIEEMAQHDISFESHTHRHEIVKYVEPELMRYELTESKRILESKLDRNIQHFCYPNGDFDEQKFSVLQECGYKYAYTLHNRRFQPSSSPLFAVPRFLVYEDVAKNMSYFKCRLLEWPKYA